MKDFWHDYGVYITLGLKWLVSAIFAIVRAKHKNIQTKKKGDK